MSGLLAFLFETAKTMVGEATITAFVAKLKDGQTRKRVLENLRLQLGVLGIKGEQADYIIGEFTRSDALQRIGQLNTLAEIQNEVAYCLNLPAQFHVGDPRAEESELVTAALYLALLAVNRPGQYQSLVDEPKVREKMLEYLPTIGEAVQEKQERRKAPLKMAGDDIKQVLVKAGQRQASVSITAAGIELNGPFDLTFKAEGENAKRLSEWFADPQSGRLVLDVEDGRFELTAGNVELDQLLFPGQASQMVFELAPVELQAKLKIVGDRKTKFIDGVFLYLPHENEIHLTIGNERCELKIIFRLGPYEPTTVNFKIHADERPLHLRDAELLEALELFFTEGSRLQVLSWFKKATGQKEQPKHETFIFMMDQQLEEANRFRWAIHVHALLLKVVKLISEAGFDPDELFLPDLPFDKAVDALQQILDTHDAAGIGKKVQITAVPTRSGYKQLQQAVVPLLRIGNEIGFGPVAVVSHRNVTDFQIVRADEKPESDGVDVLIEGKWGEGEVRFLTPEQYQLEFGYEGGQP